MGADPVSGTEALEDVSDVSERDESSSNELMLV